MSWVKTSKRIDAMISSHVAESAPLDAKSMNDLSGLDLRMTLLRNSHAIRTEQSISWNIRIQVLVRWLCELHARQKDMWQGEAKG